MAGDMTISRREALGFGATGVALAAVPGWARAAGGTAIDAIVGQFMSGFQVPGIGVAVVRAG